MSEAKSTKKPLKNAKGNRTNWVSMSNQQKDSYSQNAAETNGSDQHEEIARQQCDQQVPMQESGYDCRHLIRHICLQCHNEIMSRESNLLFEFSGVFNGHTKWNKLNHWTPDLATLVLKLRTRKSSDMAKSPTAEDGCFEQNWTIE